MIRSLARLVILGSMLLPAVASGAALEPLHSDGMPLPLPKPDPALMYPTEPVDIEIPLPRPDLATILPRATRTVTEMFLQQTGRLTSDEATYRLKSGEGLATLLRRAGFERADAAAAIEAVIGRASLRSLPVGLEVRAARDGFAFTARNGRDIFAIRDPEEGWLAFTAIRPVERYLAYAQGVIDDSIYRAASASDIPDPALAEYIRVMGFSVDFQREIRSGDAFELLYEQQVDQITGEVIGTELHYAGLMLSGKQLGYYRYDHDGARVGWYDRTGNSAARTLIRTPISGARLSSSYGMRRHPISGYNSMHRGIDFAAPTGTPIIAAGSGVVTEAGWYSSYGRYIRIRHNSTYDTAYAHMSRIARGVRPGARVEQGQVIGYVGSTGRSTGPHLHYEILVNNRKVNPLTVSLPTGERIPPDLLDKFNAKVELVETEVLATGNMRFAAMKLLPSESGRQLAP
ncbi:MAG: peptidoglycan DD-metalloendopeptidase family protein [Rhodobiaceae bacterium]|jgi:murein DD-endopeptidase MepM/ murein hydrolase activator NlpD